MVNYLLVAFCLLAATAHGFESANRPLDENIELSGNEVVVRAERSAHWNPRSGRYDRPTPSPTFPRPNHETRFKRDMASGSEVADEDYAVREERAAQWGPGPYNPGPFNPRPKPFDPFPRPTPTFPRPSNPFPRFRRDSTADIEVKDGDQVVREERAAHWTPGPYNPRPKPFNPIPQPSPTFPIPSNPFPRVRRDSTKEIEVADEEWELQEWDQVVREERAAQWSPGPYSPGPFYPQPKPFDPFPRPTPTFPRPNPTPYPLPFQPRPLPFEPRPFDPRPFEPIPRPTPTFPARNGTRFKRDLDTEEYQMLHEVDSRYGNTNGRSVRAAQWNPTGPPPNDKRFPSPGNPFPGNPSPYPFNPRPFEPRPSPFNPRPLPFEPRPLPINPPPFGPLPSNPRPNFPTMKFKRDVPFEEYQIMDEDENNFEDGSRREVRAAQWPGNNFPGSPRPFEPSPFNPQPSPFNPRPSPFNPQPSPFNPRPSPFNPQTPTFNPRPFDPIPRPTPTFPKPPGNPIRFKRDLIQMDEEAIERQPEIEEVIRVERSQSPRRLDKVSTVPTFNPQAPRPHNSSPRRGRDLTIKDGQIIREEREVHWNPKPLPFPSTPPFNPQARPVPTFPRPGSFPTFKREEEEQILGEIMSEQEIEERREILV